MIPSNLLQAILERIFKPLGSFLSAAMWSAGTWSTQLVRCRQWQRWTAYQNSYWISL